MQQCICSSVAEAMGIVAARLQQASSPEPLLYLPGNTATIKEVEQWIFDNPENLRGTHVFQMLSLGAPQDWSRAAIGGVTPVTAFVGPGIRALVNAGLAKNIRCHLSKVPALFKSKKWRPEVAIAHVSPADAVGRVTLGLNAGLDFTAVAEARFKVAVINERMPRWYIGKYYDPESGREFESGCAMFLHEFDLVVHIKQDLVEHVMVPKADEIENASNIANHIISLLAKDKREDGSLPHTVQLGIGAVPNAIADQLAENNQPIEGVWSEMFSDGILKLYQRGLIRRTTGAHLRGRIVVGFVLGSNELYYTMHENPDFLILPQEVVNDPALIALNDHMVSVNSALSVSMNGEVVGATVGKKIFSDVGGQHDFAFGASYANGGLAFIALSSTAHPKGGSAVSKIVATHSEGSHYTISADLPVIFVTEQGYADLRLADDRERVSLMMALVHPEIRTQVAKQVRSLPAMQGVDSILPRLAKLRDGRTVVVRPATNADIEKIKEYISHLSACDRETRYHSSGMTLEALTNDRIMRKRYDETLDHIHHSAFVVEHESRIIGVANAYEDEDGKFELAFSRDSEMKGLGIGTLLMGAVIVWAKHINARELHAVTYASGNPRMRSLFDRFGFISHNDEDDYKCVRYRGQVANLPCAA